MNRKHLMVVHNNIDLFYIQIENVYYIRCKLTLFYTYNNILFKIYINNTNPSKNSVIYIKL